MTEEIFSELETKIEGLIVKFHDLKQENDRLEKEIEIQKGNNQDLEAINLKSKEEIAELKDTFENQQRKLDVTAERIQGLLSKLESIE